MREIIYNLKITNLENLNVGNGKSEMLRKNCRNKKKKG